MKRIHMKLAALPLACLVITVAGCGGGGGDSTSTTAATTAPGTGTSTPSSPTSPTSPTTQTAASSSAMLSGTTDPGPEIGKDGDFYFDTTTGTLYGPKAGGKWPTSGATAGTGTIYNGNFNVPDTLSRGSYAMTGAGGAVPLPTDFGVVIPYDCTKVTLTASTLGKVRGTLDISVYKVTGSGASVTLAPVKDLSCKVTNGLQNCSQEVPSGTVNHNDKLQVQVDNNQATDWGGLTVNLACVK